jgi:hypothetical protein
MKIISCLNVKNIPITGEVFNVIFWVYYKKNHLSENQMLKFCINSNSLKVLRVTCSYINNCLTLRNEIIQYS